MTRVRNITDSLVCVFISMNPKPGSGSTINVLTYGDGSARVYHPEQVDSRLGTLATVATLSDLKQWSDGDCKSPVLVPIKLARRILPGTIFADPAEPMGPTEPVKNAAELADDALQAECGCRFGTPNFCTPESHPDCHN